MTIEIVAIAVALLFLAAALVTLWLGARLLKIENTGVLIALVLTPAIIYLVVSGRISEFSGPGGVQAKFLNAAEAPVRLVPQGVAALVEPVQGIARGESDQLERKLRDLDPLEAVILTVKLGQTYNARAWLEYVNALIRFPSFQIAVLLDEYDRFLAFMTAKSIRDVLAEPTKADRLIRLIAERSTDEILEFPRVETVTVSPGTTAIDALRDMRKNKLDVLLVVGEDRKVNGIIDMQDILSQIIFDLVAGTGGSGE